MTDEERVEKNKRIRKKFKDMTEGSSAMLSALRGSDGLSTKEAWGSSKALQSAVDASGLSSIQSYFDEITSRKAFLPDMRIHTSGFTDLPESTTRFSALKDSLESITALPNAWRDIYGLSASSRLAEEMRRQQAFYLEPLSAFAAIQNDVTADLRRSIQEMVLPRLNIKDTLGIGRMADTLSSARVFQSLGFGPDYDAQMQIITSSLNGHVASLAAARSMRDIMFPVGLTDAIEDLLARSLAAQEEMLATYKASAVDAKAEARFNRRMVTLATIINVLMFFMTVAINIEDLMTDKDTAVNANTEAVRKMQHSFNEMATQAQRMNELQEDATEQDRAADAAIADVLREIADRLADQADVTE